MRKLLIICFLIIFSISCNQDKHDYENIKINLDSKDCNVNIKINKIVELETNDNCLIGRVTRITFIDSNIYIFDHDYRHNLVLFNNSGKFIATIKNGKGPGEIIRPGDYYIDSLANKVFLWDQEQYKMLELSMSLRLLKETHHPDLIIRSFEKIDKDNWLIFARCQDSEDLKNGIDISYNYLVFSNNFEKVEKKILPISKNLLHCILENPISRSNQLIFSTQCYNNLYYIKNGNVDIKYKLDFGEYTVTDNDIKKGKDFCFDLANKGLRVMSIDNLINNSNYMAFSFLIKQELQFIIHSKVTKNNYYSDVLFKNGLLPRGLLKGTDNENSFILVVNPKDYKDYCLRNKIINGNIQNIKEENNPILMLFSLEENNN